MPDDLYDRDVLAWSEHQADLLRRIARGERVNDVDWAHVVEEIEDVGLSELNAVQRYTPSMRQRIDVTALYGRALDQLEALTHDGVPPVAVPAACPFTLDQLLTARRHELEGILAAG